MGLLSETLTIAVQVIVAAGAGIVAGAITGFAAGFMKDYSLSSRVDALEARIERVHNSVISSSGVAARTVKGERLGAAVARGLQLMQAKTADGAPMKVEDVVTGLATEYPDVAADLIQQQLRKQLSGRGGLLGKLFGG